MEKNMPKESGYVIKLCQYTVRGTVLLPWMNSLLYITVSVRK